MGNTLLLVAWVTSNNSVCSLVIITLCAQLSLVWFPPQRSDAALAVHIISLKMSLCTLYCASVYHCMKATALCLHSLLARHRSTPITSHSPTTSLSHTHALTQLIHIPQSHHTPIQLIHTLITSQLIHILQSHRTLKQLIHTLITSYSRKTSIYPNHITAHTHAYLNHITLSNSYIP